MLKTDSHFIKDKKTPNNDFLFTVVMRLLYKEFKKGFCLANDKILVNG